MNKFIVGTCAGVLSLVVSQYVIAQTVPAKPAARKAPAKKEATKKAEPVATAGPEGV